jgi:hypothetical protein
MTEDEFRERLARWRSTPRDEQVRAIGAQHARPSARSMARSFLGAMRDLVADGGRIAPRDVRRYRRAACLACPRHDPARDSCSKCGCGSVVPGGLAAKLAIASSECPDDPPRWGPV